MVIQHNMLAWNAGRQLGINTKKNAKAVEKLSSGYKINRAADDAAGLGISEKMRRQIRGLSQASDNAQDGISLCQVADGALNEVSDMLHRITELSVKSANGTNTQQDREYIQSEIQELLQEIDRISDTTTFNEQKIFSAEGEVAVTASDRLKGSLKAAISNTTAKSGEYQLDVSENDGVKLMIRQNGGLTEETAFNWNEITNKADSTKTLADTDIEPGIYQFEKKGIAFTFTVESGSSRKEIAEALNGAEFTLKNELRTFEPFTVEPKETKPTGQGANPGAEAFFASGPYSVKADEDGIWMTNNNGITTSKVTWSYMGVSKNGIAGSTIDYKCPDTGFEVRIKVKGDASFQDVLDSLNSSNVSYQQRFPNFSIGGGPMEGDASLSIRSYGTITENSLKNELSSYVDRQWVNAYASLTGTSLADAKMVITMNGYNGGNVTLTLEPDVATKTYLASLGTTIAPGVQQTLKFEDQNGNTFTMEFVSQNGCQAADLLNKGGGSGTGYGRMEMNAASVIHTERNVSDMKWAGYSAENSETGRGFWIHSGAEAGVGMWLEVDAMSTKILGMEGMDISTVEGAEEAMESVKKALQKVSANRSKIGAQQNRLEHTVKNLDNVIENTQDAESVIRDTDMAAVMVEYANNSILLQAGQSMLAQAQQSNQGILHLLQ